MKTLPIAVVLIAVTLSSLGCDGRSDPIVVNPAAPAPAAPSVVVVPQAAPAAPAAPTVVVVPGAAPAPIIVERERHDRDRVVVVEAPVVYREIYIEGRPAPSIRIEVVPSRPHTDAVWVAGRWEREHDDHEGKRREQWGWHVGFWR